MLFRDLVFFSVASILSNPIKSALIVISFCIGIAAPVFVFGISNGMAAQIEQWSTETYRRKLNIYKIQSNERSFTPHYRDLRTINELPLDLSSIGGFKYWHQRNVSFESRETTSLVAGITSNALSAIDRSIIHGQGNLRIRNLSNVPSCILNDNLANYLELNPALPGGSELSRKPIISVNGLDCEVIGIAGPEPYRTSSQRVVFLELVEARRYINSIEPVSRVGDRNSEIDDLDRITILFQRQSDLEKQKNTILQALNSSRERPAIRLNPEELFHVRFNVDHFKRTKRSLEVFMASVMFVIIAFVVVNTGLNQYYDMRERTQELSVQMALGAKRRDLCSLVLIEMMITTMIGGLLGIILAVGAAEPFSKSTDLQMLIDGGVLISATMIGLAIGLFSSISSLWLVINISPSESFRQ